MKILSNLSAKLLIAAFAIATIGLHQLSAMEPAVQPAGQTIKLAWQGAGPGEGIEVPLAAANHSATIKSMLEDLGGAVSDVAIPIHNVSNNTLKRIVACLKIIEAGGDVKIALENYVKELSQVELKMELYELLLAANYLDIKPLLDACAQAWATQHIPNQVTSEQI